MHPRRTVLGVASLLLFTSRIACTPPDTETHTPLHHAARAGDVDVAKLLLDRGADVNAPANQGMMALHLAARARSAEGVAFLLERGADTGACNELRQTPIALARARRSEAVGHLLEGEGVSN